MNCFCIVPFTISTRPENICKILPETQSGKCLHNLGFPLGWIISAGAGNKMCPGPGLTLGLIIRELPQGNCNQKANDLSSQLSILSSPRCRLLQSLWTDCSTAESQHSGWWPDTIIHHRPGISLMIPALTSSDATPLSPGLSTDNIHAIRPSTIQTQSRSRH